MKTGINIGIKGVKTMNSIKTLDKELIGFGGWIWGRYSDGKFSGVSRTELF